MRPLTFLATLIQIRRVEREPNLWQTKHFLWNVKANAYAESQPMYTETFGRGSLRPTSCLSLREMLGLRRSTRSRSATANTRASSSSGHS